MTGGDEPGVCTGGPDRGRRGPGAAIPDATARGPHGDGGDSAAAPPDPDELVARNRATPRRGAPPGREQTGWHVTRRWLVVTGVVVLLATGVLVATLLRA